LSDSFSNRLFWKKYGRNIIQAAAWTKRSTCRNGGSSAYYLPCGPTFGIWAPPYPETSGYIVPSLIQYADFASQPRFLSTAYRMAHWLCKVQIPNGAFTSGPIRGKPVKLSVFNTAQIIFGLLAAFRRFNEERFLICARRAAEWVCSVQEPDGRWLKYAYVNGYFPSYYSHVAWPLLEFWKQTGYESAKDAAQKALARITERIGNKLWIPDMGFQPNKPAFTHTIAYTVHGLLESAILLNEGKLLEITMELSEKLLRIVEIKGLAGAYTEEWKPSWKGVCVTGHCQTALIFLRICERTSDWRYLNASLKLLDIAANAQVLRSLDRSRIGALPGSVPFWGRYMRFRYPNWAAKFFLDATIRAQKLKEQ